MANSLDLRAANLSLQTTVYGNNIFENVRAFLRILKQQSTNIKHNDSFKNIYKWSSKGCPWPTAAASPGNLIGMLILRPHCKPTESETAGSQEVGVKHGERGEGGKYGRNPGAL